MWRLVIGVLLLLTATPAWALAGVNGTYSAAEATSFAWDDLRRLPVAVYPYTRYLSLAHLPPKERPLHVRVLTHHLGILSRNPDFVPPTAITLTPVQAALFPLTLTPIAPSPYVLTNVVPAADCLLWDAVLLRFDMRDYRDYKGRGFPHNIWENLKFVDPYFLVRISEYWPGGYGDDGHYYVAGSYRRAEPGEWLDRKIWAQLALATNSRVPIVRGDWFFSVTAVQFGHDGYSYYDFLELGKDEKDFQSLVGADGKKTEELFGEFGAVIKRSSLVAVNNRHLRRQPAFNRDPRGGNYWYTIDFEKSTDKSNAVRILNGLKGDASEQIGRNPAGLGAFWLQDAKKKRQDVPPPAIAVNMKALHPDLVQVHVPLNCITCHQTVIIPPDDYIRRIMAAGFPIQSPDYTEAKKLRALYVSDLQEAVRLDIAAYDATTFRVCGLNSRQLAKAYGVVWERYWEEDVLLDRAALELGVQPGRLLDALRKQLEKTKQGDPVFAAWLAGEGVRREHFEEGVVVIMKILKDYP